MEEDVEDQAWDGEDVEDVATGRQAPASGRQAPIRPQRVPNPLHLHGPGNVASGYQNQHQRPRQASMKCKKKKKNPRRFINFEKKEEENGEKYCLAIVL